MKKILAFAFSLLLTSNVWAADNTVVITAGSGLTLRSRDVGAGVQSLQQILGDTSGAALATAPGIPNSVFALPIQGVTGGTAVPISGSLTNISGTISLPTGAATAALQGTNTATTAHTCSTAGYSELGCLGQIDDDVKTGASATGAAVPGGAIYAAGLASSTEPTKATTGNLTGLRLDLAGGLIVAPYANRENMVRGAASTTGTGATTVIAASGSASLKTYITNIECGRDDAGTTAIHVTFNDVGGTGSGTQLVLPNNGGGGGNNPPQLVIPLVTAANTAFTFTSSNSITNVYCSAQGYTGY